MTKKLKRTILDSELSDIYESATSDFKHPLLTLVKFVFADDSPNGNNQGIAHADFEDVKQSAIDMPIKMKFLGEAGAGGHGGSVTIGHIKGMEEEEIDDIHHRLIAEGALYADEYPKEVAYLKEAFASGKAPGVSWEIDYHNEVKEGAVSWLKGIVTRAATFVRNPAYGTRTALLALASDDNISDEDLSKELTAIINGIEPKNTNKGGSNKVEEELKKLQAELEAKIKEIETLQAEKATLLTANAELEGKVTEQEKALAEVNRAKLITERTAQAAEAGLKIEAPDALAKKQEFWASLSDAAFAEYLADLTAAKAAAATPAPAAGILRSAIASGRDPLPRPDPSGGAEGLSVEDIKAEFRKLNRAN